MRIQEKQRREGLRLPGRENRERAFAQAKDLGLTVVEMVPCAEAGDLNRVGAGTEPVALNERLISFWAGFFLPFLLTNIVMAFVFRLRGFVWSVVGSFMLVPMGFFLYGSFAVGNVLKSGEFTGAIVWIPFMLAAGAVLWLPFRLMKTVRFKYI